jgi:hypothetical protein
MEDTMNTFTYSYPVNVEEFTRQELLEILEACK